MLALDIIRLILLQGIHLSDLVIDIVREELVGDEILQRRVANQPLVEVDIIEEEQSIRCLRFVLERLLVDQLEYISPALPPKVRSDVAAISF